MHDKNTAELTAQIVSAALRSGALSAPLIKSDEWSRQ